MNMALWIVISIIGLIILFLLAVQFIKIGGILKKKMPFLYAIYLIFWILFFGLASIIAIFGVQSEMQSRKEQAIRQERQTQIEQGAIKYNVGKDKASREIETYEIFCKNCYLSDNDKYIILLLYRENMAKFVKKAKQNGFSDKEIAEYYGLYIYKDINIQSIIEFGKSNNTSNDVIYKALFQAGLLDEYLANNTEQQIRKSFDLQ